MTRCRCQLVAKLFLAATAARPIGAQAAHFSAGGGAGGSVVGWQPRVAMSGDVGVLALGPFEAAVSGSLARITANDLSFVELNTGARVSLGSAAAGWWLGTDMVRRNGFRDAVEQPRIETGGWRRIGNVVVTISTARRSAQITSLSRTTRQVTEWQYHVDTLVGALDSVQVSRTIHDSSRVTAADRWADAQAGLAWSGRRLALAVTFGGRLASRGVPSALWGSADVGFKISEPMALVLGAGNAAGSHFALDAEHRYLSLGVRLTPPSRSKPEPARRVNRAVIATSFAIDTARAGQFRLTVTAPGARTVDVSGDFTSWKPVALTAAGDGTWTLVTPLAAGTHRLNLRIDNGSWVAPPGLTTMNDDFAGEVGLLVIERSPAAR